jgi:hypothetical protein
MITGKNEMMTLCLGMAQDSYGFKPGKEFVNKDHNLACCRRIQKGLKKQGFDLDINSIDAILTGAADCYRDNGSVNSYYAVYK